MWNKKADGKAHMRKDWKQKKPSNEELTIEQKADKVKITQVTLSP